ncbi:hypothetical protein EUTSA_v10011082mg [Eutrema salsugineum]|uniref:UBC core domain-containing protein n=2 Tax=Eutrema salsugineum TaxID=72664 RepID=V4M147_EUTSA|nr:hypothetical protein EUTSA_v10011082mg [Eutrema salsugineum]
MTLFHIRRSLKDLEDHPSPFYNAGVKDDDIYEWTATIIGPKNTPYEGGVFSLGIHFDPGFSLKAPSMHFKAPIFHPNASHLGNIFHPMLVYDTWCLMTTVCQMLMMIHDMLIHLRIEEKDVVREDVEDMFPYDRVRFDEHAWRWIQLHAMW